MKVTCKKVLEELVDYMDQRLESSAGDSYERHLHRCRPCRTVCDTTRQTVYMYRHWVPEPLPAEIEFRLFATLERRYGKYRCGT